MIYDLEWRVLIRNSQFVDRRWRSVVHTCSLGNKLEIVPGDLDDYKRLACYHYRGGLPISVKAVFTMRPATPISSFERRPVGVIVYTTPVPRVELRNVATGNIFKDLDRQTQLALINRNIRCIARVIVEPRFRGIGLATRLVRETMPRRSPSLKPSASCP